MIQDGFDYGEGYEKATEPGPYVEIKIGDEPWSNNTQYNTIKHPQEIFNEREFKANCGVYRYRKPIKPKEEKMDEPMIPVRDSALWDYQAKSQKYCVTLAEAERLGEEAKRIKAEIAKREEIGPGDWCRTGCKIFKCSEINGNYAISRSGDQFYLGCCKKLHPTPEVKAWLDSVTK